MKGKYTIWIPVLWTVAALGGCTKSTDEGGTTPPDPSLGGYADPDAVVILNQGAPRKENSSITWIAPDGRVEEQVYRTVNGTAFGNTAQDLWLHDGRIYLLSNSSELPDLGSNEPADGSLVIVDAETFRREKVFRYEELTFHKPEGSLDASDILPLSTPLENIAVLDEHNVFISEDQGMFRLDVTTGEMTIVKGSYAFGNQGNTIEAIIATRGMTVIGDHLYCAGGGFWTNSKLFEFTRGKDEVTRTLDLSGEFISGICRTGEHELLVATCGRSGSLKSYLTFVDTESWSVRLEKPLSADLSAEFMNSSGVTLCGDWLYFAAGSLTVRRVSLQTWKVEDYVDVTKDAPNAAYLTCNVVADPKRERLYVSVSNELGEAIVSDGNVLVYDCSGDTPQLLMNLENRTSYPVNIYPMSRFE